MPCLPALKKRSSESSVPIRDLSVEAMTFPCGEAIAIALMFSSRGSLLERRCELSLSADQPAFFAFPSSATIKPSLVKSTVLLLPISRNW